MRLCKLALLGLSTLASPSFTQEPIDTPAPDPHMEREKCGEDDHCATTGWTETVTSSDNVVVLFHPHADTRNPTSVRAITSENSRSGTESLVYSGSTITGLELSDISSILSKASLISFSMLAGTPVSISSSTTSTSHPPHPTNASHPLDSSEIKICTGGSFKNCIAAYPCNNEPTEPMNCFCRNNVAQGCNDACGGIYKVEPEECHMMPVGDKPSGLPPAGDVPRIRVRNIDDRLEGTAAHIRFVDRARALLGVWPVGAEV
ncbi:hypothetical protein TWF694_010974 [Orbilia ellipsospora]|uniref:Extracellular membrane protein CFEM domain-containing protein n=1 Tax=Orbilia ellipsospora TaxID=2528407 RepID=A0AAV9X7M8_9PEZI